ncbi:MAG TPA: hypothetical protein VN894_11200, partial [Polyangiaceae bacterium]|nr:hypothetical protein [Polyangiaceae bacterium]
MPPLAWLSPRRSVAASVALVALVALASAAACSVLVGDSLPHYTCSLDPTYTQVCSDIQVCAPIEGQPDPPTRGNCVDRCSHTRCSTGLSCGANDWCVSVNDASADGTTGGDSTMAEANGDDAADEDEDETTDATADGLLPMRSDAGSDAPADATSNAEGGRGDAGVCASGGIGCPCSAPGTTTGCELLAFCADREIVPGVSMGDAGAGAAGAGGDAAVGVCTKACCASTDCDKGSVCLATGAGG